MSRQTVSAGRGLWSRAPYSKVTNRPSKKFSLPELTPSLLVGHKPAGASGRPCGTIAAADGAPAMVRWIRLVPLDVREQGQGKALR
jgi:hypothetical protein